MSSDVVAELARRMARPQRHRLLQGYPAVPAMSPAVPAQPPRERREDPGLVRTIDGRLIDHDHDNAIARLTIAPFEFPAQMAEAIEAQRQTLARWQALADAPSRAEPPFLQVDRARGLIVGVIPHTQCIPRKEGCGFCTFPHDAANKHARASMVDTVIHQLRILCETPEIAGRVVDAIYIGGGTANLSSTDEIAGIVQTMGRAVKIADAELTLEGTPQLFAAWFGSHMKNLALQPVAHKRISMGVQTFDKVFLQQMGREKFGDAAMVRKLIKQCRSLSITTSADLLYNLPGQTAAQMDLDVDTAIELGLDQICIYNLVLYEGLGTPWSQEPALVAAMPDNDVACANWLRLRGRLLAAGYVQSTLTNFERADVARGPRRFRYEVDSFSPEAFDGVGVGPMSISSVVDWSAMRGLKLLRRKDLDSIAWSGGDLLFRYEREDLRHLFIVRSLAKGWFYTWRWRALFGTDFAVEFAEQLAPVVDAGLLFVDDDRVSFSPRGAFYADAVVSTLTQQARRDGAGLSTTDLLREEPRAGRYLSMG